MVPKCFVPVGLRLSITIVVAGLALQFYYDYKIISAIIIRRLWEGGKGFGTHVNRNINVDLHSTQLFPF